MTDIEELLREAMREQAPHLTLPPGAATRALHAVRRRRLIGRTGAGLVLAAVVAGAVVLTQLPRPDRVPSTGPTRAGDVTLTLTPSGSATARQLTSAADIVRARLAAQGVTAHTSVYGGAVTVSAPASARAAVDSAALPGVLSFREIYTDPSGKTYAMPAAGPSAEGTAVGTTVTGLNPPAGEPNQTTPSAATLGQFAALDCSTSGGRPRAVDEDPHHFVVACDRTGQTKYLLKPADLVGNELASATATTAQNETGALWVVDLNFQDSAVDQVKAVSTRLFHNNMQQLAITVDGVVLSAPSVNGVLGKTIEISGGIQPFSQREARALASDVTSGPLPTALTVGPPIHRQLTLPSGQGQLQLLLGPGMPTEPSPSVVRLAITGPSNRTIDARVGQQVSVLLPPGLYSIKSEDGRVCATGIRVFAGGSVSDALVYPITGCQSLAGPPAGTQP